MAHRLHFAVVALLACLLPLTYADILPPHGTYVPYKVEVTSMPQANDMRLAIFPWGMSNGAPTGDIKFVEPHTPVDFGRRISGGSPAFWAVRAEKISEIDAVRTAAGDSVKSTDAIDAWLHKSGNAVLCQGQKIARRFLAESGEDMFVDKFVVTALNAGRCTMIDAEAHDNEIKDDLGSYAEESTDGSPDAKPEDQDQESKWNSWGSLAFSGIALGAICALAWRLSSLIRKTSGDSYQVQE